MPIGISGHQHRPGLDWQVVRRRIREIILTIPQPQGWSCLAAGADQLFAEEILAAGGTLHAVVPLEKYESFFSDKADLRGYRRLLQQAATTHQLPGKRESPEDAFFAAGRYLVDHVSQLIAVWNGLPAAGKGGTADIVDYALEAGVPVLHIDPFAGTVSRLGPLFVPDDGK